MIKRTKPQAVEATAEVREPGPIKEWADRPLVRRKVSQLVPYARNARVHSDEQISRLMGLIREFGFTNPILIDENDRILAGHGRQIAAQRLGDDEVDCRLIAGLTDAQKKALTLSGDDSPA